MYAVRSRDSNALLELLKGQVKNGVFNLTSGKPSPFYINVKTVALNPQGAIALGKILYREIRSFEGRHSIVFKGVGGLEVGSVPIATSVAMTSSFAGQPINAFIVRKNRQHGMKDSIDGMDNLERGDFVAIVEDVLTTGESAKLAIARTLDMGLSPRLVLAVVDREEDGSPIQELLGLPVKSLFTAKDLKCD